MYWLSAYLYGTVNGRVPAEALIIRTQGSSDFPEFIVYLAKGQIMCKMRQAQSKRFAHNVDSHSDLTMDSDDA